MYFAFFLKGAGCDWSILLKISRLLLKKKEEKNPKLFGLVAFLKKLFFICMFSTLTQRETEKERSNLAKEKGCYP